VVDLGSVSAAARDLGESKGSISRRITRLERRVGTALLGRTGRKIQPTEDGLAYREKIGEALALMDDALLDLQDAHAEPSGHLRVTAPTDLAILLVAPMLAAFSEAYPSVTVELLLTDQALSFRDHRIDIALRATGTLPDSSLIAHRLVDLGHEPFASPDYLARHGTPQHPNELSSHRLLSPFPAGRPTATMFVSTVCKDIEVPLQSHLISGDMTFLREAARHGAGIAILPTVIARADVTAGRLVRVLPRHDLTLYGHLYLLHAGGHHLPAKVRAFRDFFRASLHETLGALAR
jgi:DNA-binding transcriptional LysR family regulator